ncbi:MAG: NosD domain-containing protein [Candidatus Thorarchaeota archaeon]
MGQDVRNDSRVCRTPPGSMNDLSLYFRPNPILVAVSLTLILMASGLAYYWMLPKPLPIIDVNTPHAVIAIDGDAEFSDTALLEGWPGDGSPENPFIIDGLDIDLGGGEGHCIMISNTRVSFTISNCNLTGAEFGIFLDNVTNGELVNNTCNSNNVGISLEGSHSNTVANNTCLWNWEGIYLIDSESNTVANNTCNNNVFGIRFDESDFNIIMNNACNSNNRSGIYLHTSNSNTVAKNTCNGKYGIGINYGIGLSDSEFNTVVNNTCHYNVNGISIWGSNSNTVANNTWNSNGIGIYLRDSEFNTVVNNACSNNNIGICIYLYGEVSNTVKNNAFLGNTRWDIVQIPVAEEPVFDELAHKEYVAKQFVWFLGGCGMILVVSVIALVQFRRMEI